ncbi:MAG TPA: response regulator transcription factor [Trichormus sp.]|jgi:OmpR-family two-component system manganese-sensing response regulator
MARILLVEDDETVSTIVVTMLERDRHTVDSCADGVAGQKQLLNSQYDLAILDWQLPEISGVDLCKQLRATGSAMPVLFLTSRSGAANIQIGLDAGGDDYLVKPFAPPELEVRVRALLRRPKKLSASELRCGDLVMNMSKGVVTFHDDALPLTDNEYSVLQFMLRHQGEVCSPEQLLDHVWHSQSDASYDAVASCVKRLRKKLERKGSASLIKTSYGMGYKLES